MRYRFLRFPGGLSKAITLSYDDGCTDDIRFCDRITEAGLKCTFNLTSRKMVDAIPVETIKEKFLGRGHEIAVHGAFHRAEGNIRAIEGIKDVLECRLELEKEYGMIIRGMAFPDTGIRIFHNNASYESIKSYLKDLDIVYSRTLGGDNKDFMLPSDWHAWMPSAHHSNPEIFEYIDEFLKIDISEKAYGARRHPRLFYMWGHSFEFKDKWELLDAICEKLTGHEDVWYATNMEIYEYVTAYNSLVFSADETIIYNPTLKEVWFDVDCKPYSIKPGETLKIS